ncbi:MAG: hypothetical protein LBH13_04745 [Cellulomonadaceae bacterium]|jgi:accessory Sec system glycosyltransferase GtfB|nr:hypothetical protein [Cellulomonadaceae bacterium]
MIALFDSVTNPGLALLRSLDIAGVDVTPVVINYRGELPEGAQCPFADLTGLPRDGKPLFFNEIPTPPFAEIRHGKETWGEVLDGDTTIARIHYVPNSFRQVERVDWLLQSGGLVQGDDLTQCDRYDSYGNRHAVSYFAGNAQYETVYSGPGEWSITLHQQGSGPAVAVTALSAGQGQAGQRRLGFGSLVEFICWYLEDAGLLSAGAEEELLINSLSTPLLVARARAMARRNEAASSSDAAPNTTLFWQEPTGEVLPGNMTLELAEPLALKRIVFADKAVLDRVRAEFPDTPVELEYLSPLDQFPEQPPGDAHRAFTLTTTDSLPILPELLAEFPQVTFVVAAPTLMSDKLHNLAKAHSNLELLPTASQKEVLEELQRAGVYLDINAGIHVSDVVPTAYHMSRVVLAQAPYVKDPAASVTCTNAAELKSLLRQVTSSPSARAEVLAALHTQHGPLSTPTNYLRVLGR